MNPLLLQQPCNQCETESSEVQSENEVKRLAFGGDLFRSELAARRVEEERLDEDEAGADESSSIEEADITNAEAWKKWKGLLGINWLRTYAQFVKERYRVNQLMANSVLKESSADNDDIDEENEWPIERQGRIFFPPSHLHVVS